MFLNKVAGALLAVLLVLLALPTLSDIIFGKGGHHGGHHEEEAHSLNERFAASYAYYLPVEEGAGGAEVEEEVFDLGAMLAMASVEDGASSFRSKCSSCHNAEDPGVNGAGPALHDVVGRAFAAADGFGGYSGTLASMEGEWDYEALDAFLLNPRGYVNGTAMSFAGLRRDPERMNVIAYLASQSPNAPPFPAPLPAEEEMAAEVEVDVEAPQGEALEEAAEDLTEAGNDAAAAVAEEAAGIVEQIEDAADEAVEDATEAADEAVNGRRGPTNH